MTDEFVTERQLKIMQHTLGVAQNGQEYRNHFVADEGHADWDDLHALVDKGYMGHMTSSVSPDHVFYCTELGRGYVRGVAAFREKHA